jgi:putative redox protein
MKVTVSPTGAPYAYEVKARHHTLSLDVAKPQKGGDTAANPHEAALGALGACTAITLALYIDTKKWPVSNIQVTVDEDTIDDPNDTSAGTKRRIPHIVETITFEGDLTDEQLAKLKEYTEKCPVFKLMRDDKVMETVLKPVKAKQVP